MILGINAVGQLATRLLGARLGVPMLGLVSGFISSSATIGAMGAWARQSGLLGRGRGSGAFNGGQLCADGRFIAVTDHSAFLATAAPVAAAALAAASPAVGSCWRHGAKHRQNRPGSVALSM
jgi:uncharacterized membrane protein (DUF4010 family)